MDERLRRLFRDAKQGDRYAQERLDNMPVCQIHEIIASDPAGWGSPRACPYCELDIWCGDACGKPTCHKCSSQFDCEYGHETCFEMEDEFRQPLQPEPDEEEEYDGRYDCASCHGTTIGMRPDSVCGWCGGSGIEPGSPMPPGYYDY